VNVDIDSNPDVNLTFIFVPQNYQNTVILQKHFIPFSLPLYTLKGKEKGMKENEKKMS